MEKPHTGFNECPRFLLSCFRARNFGRPLDLEGEGIWEGSPILSAYKIGPPVFRSVCTFFADCCCGLLTVPDQRNSRIKRFNVEFIKMMRVRLITKCCWPRIVISINFSTFLSNKLECQMKSILWPKHNGSMAGTSTPPSAKTVTLNCLSQHF